MRSPVIARPIPRRRVLMMGAGLTALAMAGACSTTPTPDQIRQYIQTIAAGLSGLMAALAASGLSIPADILDKIQTELQVIETNAALILSAITPNQQVLQQIASALQVIAVLLTPFFPGAPAIAAAVQAAVVLIGVVLQLAGIVPSPALRASAGATNMTPAQAKLILDGYGAHGIQ